MDKRTIRKIEFKTLEIFDRRGFEEIKIPLAEESLREDFTTDIAKRTLNKSLSYRGDILRISPFGKKYQVYQVGCEIIKEKLSDADERKCAETLQDVLDYISTTIKKKMLIVITHFGLARKILGNHLETFFKKNVTEIQKLLDKKEISPEIAKAFFKIFKDINEFKFLNEEEELKEVESFVKLLKLRNIAFNLSERADKDYYTGLLFSVFCNSVKLITGGKYFLFGKEGIGFSVNLTNLELL